MITIRDISKAWAQLPQHERIKATLSILGLTREEAVEKSKASKETEVSLPSVNMALSTGDRKPTQDKLEAVLKEELRRIS